MTSAIDVTARVADYATSMRTAAPVRVGIDGRSAAGKSTFAAALADAIRQSGRTAVTASIDHFHTPGHKYRSIAEEYTPATYYDTAFDYARFRSWVLDPLAPGGDRMCRLRYWDSYRDEAFEDEPVRVPADVVVVVEGGCLLRPELADCWDLIVWIDIDWAEMVERAVARDVAFVGDAEVVRRRYEGRFRGVHTLYEEATGARDRADILIDNRDALAPRVLRFPKAPSGSRRQGVRASTPHGRD